MSCGNKKRGAQRLAATSSTFTYFWFTGWLTAAGVDTIRAVVRATAASGGANNKWQVALQTAAVRQDNPDNPSVIGSEQTDAGTYGSGDLSLTLAEKAYWRVGVALRSVSGLSQGDYELDFAYNDCGKLVGAMTFPVSSDSSSNPTMIPLGEILPANFAQKFKAAIIITSADANLQAKLMYRKGTVEALLGAWSDFSTADSWSASAERNTGELSTVTTSELWVQAGLAVKSTSGSSSGQITVLLFARKT